MMVENFYTVSVNHISYLWVLAKFKAYKAARAHEGQNAAIRGVERRIKGL